MPFQNQDLIRASLGVAEVDALLNQLRTPGRTTEAGVDISEAHLGEMGFAESPSDE